MSEELHTELRGHVLWLTIDRPERRNAMNEAVIAGLTAGLARAHADPQIRCVVITGAGDKAFCAGADLQAGDAFRFDYSVTSTAYANLLRQAMACTTPIIARVNGACMAGGMGLLAMADIAIAAPTASFGLPEVKVGVFPMQVLSVLQHLIPQRLLARMCLTGAPIDASQAAAVHLISAVATDLDAEVDGCVTQIVANSPAAIRRGLYAMKRVRSMGFEESMSFTESQISLVALTEDAKEGITAFREKRVPVWPGR